MDFLIQQFLYDVELVKPSTRDFGRNLPSLLSVIPTQAGSEAQRIDAHAKPQEEFKIPLPSAPTQDAASGTIS
jgi:hypothetical protein